GGNHADAKGWYTADELPCIGRIDRGPRARGSVIDGARSATRHSTRAANPGSHRRSTVGAIYLEKSVVCNHDHRELVGSVKPTGRPLNQNIPAFRETPVARENRRASA